MLAAHKMTTTDRRHSRLVDAAYRAACAAVSRLTCVPAEAIYIYRAAVHSYTGSPTYRHMLFFPVSHARDLAIYALVEAGVPAPEVKAITSMSIANIRAVHRNVANAMKRDEVIRASLEMVVACAKAELVDQ